MQEDNRKLKKSLAIKEDLAQLADAHAREVALSMARLTKFVKHPGDVLVKARLFDDGLGKVSEAHRQDLKRLVGVMVEYQVKMEKVLEECRYINNRIRQVGGSGSRGGSGSAVGKGNEKVSGATSPVDTEQEPVRVKKEPKDAPEFTTPETAQHKTKRVNRELEIIIREQETLES